MRSYRSKMVKVTRVNMTVDREIQREYPKGISRNGQDGQDRTFALKLDNPFCPMT